MSKVKLLSLPKKLDLSKRRLIKLLDELDQLLEERAVLREIEEQLRTSEEHYRQVAESQEEFEMTLNDDEANSVMDEWAKFRQTFIQSNAKAQTLIDELRVVDVVPGSIRSAETYRNVRLPRCALPKFDGDVTKFREFWNRFESSVHQQRDLADAVKLVYLRNCLTGDALGAIAGLSAANADYQVAVRGLKERFDRPRMGYENLSNHMDHNVDAFTALGKDPLTKALTADECLITVARELLPKQARINSDATEDHLSWEARKNRHTSPSLSDRPVPCLQRPTPHATLSGNLEGGTWPTPSLGRGESVVEVEMKNRRTGIAVNPEPRGRARCPLIHRSKRIRGGEKSSERMLMATVIRGWSSTACLIQELSRLSSERMWRRSSESMLMHFRLSPLSGGPRKLIEARTTKTLCDDIFQPQISAWGWPHLRDLRLADEEEEYLTVHVVISVDYFFKMLGSTIVRAGDDVPVAVETCLRWVTCGPQTPSQLPTPTVPADKSADTECYKLLRKFWELEAIGISSEEQSLSGLEREEFERNLSFNGVRYTVHWKRNGSTLPNYYSVAQKRLSLVQRKLKRDRKRWRDYAAVIQSYLDNGWAEEAPDAGPLGRTWYVLYHAVYQKGSSGELSAESFSTGPHGFGTFP
ncbi:hypothetical protein T02_12201 [Trichinella nativa]|uniref:Integrase catalytic domain-containing protein n=1 Tax=Trichinella nativa TaxID=6335 RepID=A0A0V1KPU2_9BILA|nr:hypothetical protein T02_12201 [Trichinella nativa]